MERNMLILVVIIIVIAGAVALMVPILMGLNIFPGGATEVNVITVGVPSAGVANALTGQEAISKGIYYKSQIEPDLATISLLKKYDVVIVQGDPYCSMIARSGIGEFVQSGGKLIVVGDACSKHPEYPNVAGWSWPSGSGIPVPAEIIGAEFGYSDVAYGSEMLTMNVDHPMMMGMKLKPTLQVPSQVIKVTPKGSLITAIKTAEGTSPAIIEGGSGLGNVIYFAYDPGQTPDILLEAVAYLAGV